MSFWTFIWMILAIGLAVAEILTVTFFLMPFSIGAALAFFLALLGFPVAVQWVVFFVVSVPLVFLLRPFSQRVQAQVAQNSAIDRMNGASGVVLTTIDPTTGEGKIRVLNEEWIAQPADNTSVYQPGEKVRVVHIEGTRAIVELKDTE